jgi:hypothetical protein
MGVGECFLRVRTLSNRIELRLEENHKVKGLEHFTEGEEKGGGHGDGVLVRTWVRAHCFGVWAALRSEDSLPHAREDAFSLSIRNWAGVCFV